MKTSRSIEKASIKFCCIELYKEICEKGFPRIRLDMDTNGNIRPRSDDTIFKFCPFCGCLVETTIVLKSGERIKLP